jgi:hypothetical protein
MKREDGSLTLACLANYKEVLISFDDGSNHVTCLCSKCAREATIYDLEGLYASDMDECDKEEKLGLGKPKWDKWNNRKPIKIVRM